jgi:beta propeller repeat protein
MALAILVFALVICGAASAADGSNSNLTNTNVNGSAINGTVNGSTAITGNSTGSGSVNSTYDGSYSVNETQVCTVLGDQINPAIYGDKIVWQDNRNGNWDIYIKDLTTGVESVLCNATGDQTHPRIYNNLVVWDDCRYVNYFNIHLLDITTGIETRINPSTHSQAEPDIYNDTIVWMQWDYADANIYMYNISSGITSAVCTAPGEQWRPRIYGSKIVWYECRNGNWDIYMIDIVTGVETPVCTNYVVESDPRVYDDNIIFRDDRNGNWDIYMYNISTGIETQFTLTSSNQVDSAIYENKVVYTDDLSGNVNMYMKDILTGNVTPICIASGDQGCIGIYDNIVVWNDNRNGNWDIYMGTIGNSTSNAPPTANAGLDQTVLKNAEVFLDGSGSNDPDSDVLTYQWSIKSKPDDSLACLSNSTSVNPKITTDMSGEYVIQLIVNDGTTSSEPDIVQITAINQAPVANPDGPYVSYEGSTITFDGSSSSDPDGDALNYHWDLDGDGIFESEGVTVTRTWNDDYQGTVTLKVTDTNGASSTASTNVTVQNVAPSANISDSYYVDLPITLRVSGIPGNKVTLEIIQEGQVIANISMVKQTGIFHDQEVTLIATIDLSKPYYGRVLFEASGSGWGANPVWLIIDGKKSRVATFIALPCLPCTQEQAINVPIKGLFTLVGKNIRFNTEAFDPGMDNITFEWTSGNNQQTVIHSYTSNGTDPIIDTFTQLFTVKGDYNVTLKVRDDEGAEVVYIKTIRIV